MGEKKDFNLGDDVMLTISGEQGQVIGVASYLAGFTQYQVHYKDANGAAQTEWLYREQIS